VHSAFGPVSTLVYGDGHLRLAISRALAEHQAT